MSNNLQLHNSKLFLLLRALDKKEVKRFDLWLSSPFHNNSEKVLNLYRGLVTKHKGFDKPILTTQVQEFLIWQKSKENIIHQKRLLMDTLLERKLHTLIPAILTKSKKELAASPYRNIQFYENAFQIVEMDFYLETLLSNRNSKIRIRQLIDVSLQSTLLKVIKCYCAAKNREQIFKVKYDYPLIEAIKEYISKEFKDDIPIVWAYYIIFCMIEERDEQYFYKLKKHLFDNLTFFDLTEVRQFFNYLINYCIQTIRLGKSKFIQERQDLYELGF